MQIAVIVLVVTILLNGLLVRLEISGLIRELARLSVMASLGYLIYILIRSKRK